MTNNISGINKAIKVNGQKLETVTSFKYLGSVVSDEGSKPEILSRMAQTTAALTKLKSVWNDRSIHLSSKIRLVRSLVTFTFLYACESWILIAELRRRIRAMEMRCYRKILHSKTMLPMRKSVQDRAGNRTTRRPPDNRKVTQAEVIWTCLPFIRSGQNNLTMHSERGKKARQTEEEVGRRHQRMDKPGVRQVPEDSGEQRNIEETACEVICITPTTPAVKGYAKVDV